MSLMNVLAPVTLSAMMIMGALTPVSRTLGDAEATNGPKVTFDTGAAKAAEDTFTAPFFGATLRYGLDTTVSPCLDFYQYINGDWRARTRLGSKPGAPPKRVEAFGDTYKRTRVRLVQILDSARAIAISKTAGEVQDPTIKALGTFYQSCMIADSLEPVRKDHSARPAAENQPPKDSTRTEQCLQRTIYHMGSAVGQTFAKDLFASHAYTRMQTLLDAIRVAVIERIQANPLLSATEKERALSKMKKLRMRVGMPEKMTDYTTLELTNDYAKNKTAIANFRNNQRLKYIGTDPADQWQASLLQPNAFYNPGDHSIEIPPVMFMPPFFDTKGEDALNYGGVGMVIAHEIFHSLTPDVNNAMNPEMKAQIDSFKAFNSTLGILDGWNTNGKRTYSEDIADLGGIQIAYAAWKATDKKPVPLVDGFTPDQRFFLSIGRIWRAKWSKSAAANSDVHSAPFARVNGMVKQSPTFAKAFGCKDTDAMVLPVDKMSKIW